MMSEKSPVFANLVLHAMDHINIEYSYEHIRRIVEVFRDSGNMADICLSSGLAQRLCEEDDIDELLDALRGAVKDGYSLGMINVASHPFVNKVITTDPAGKKVDGDIDWDGLYRISERYATARQDPVSGEFDASCPGGAKAVQELFGKHPEIITRNLVTDVYFHRSRGAIISLGGYPTDWLDGWVAPPLAWFMGMVTLMQYPLAVNNWDYVFWPPDEEHARELLYDITENLPGDGPHVLFLGGHNVDFYANNSCWTAKNLGFPRHVEMWAYREGNPPSLDAARLPERYFLTEEQVEHNYNLLRLVMNTFKERAQSDPDFEVVTSLELVSRIDTGMEKKFDKKQLLEVARFVVENTGRGLPEWVPLDGKDALTLAQALDALTEAFAIWRENGNLPAEVAANGLLLGPTQRPREWRGDTTRPDVDGKTVTLDELVEACTGINKELGKCEPPDVPLYTMIGGIEVNTAELMYAAACGILNIGDGGSDKVTLKGLTMHPDPCIYARQPWLSDKEMAERGVMEQLNRLQLWTVKPVRFL